MTSRPAKNSSKQILDEAVSMAHDFDKQAKGGQLLNKNSASDAFTGENGIARISEHSEFYRKYFKEHGYAIIQNAREL